MLLYMGHQAAFAQYLCHDSRKRREGELYPFCLVQDSPGIQAYLQFVTFAYLVCVADNNRKPDIYRIPEEYPCEGLSQHCADTGHFNDCRGMFPRRAEPEVLPSDNEIPFLH